VFPAASAPRSPRTNARENQKAIGEAGEFDGTDRAKRGEGGVKVVMLILTAVGGLFLFVIFERFLKKALGRTHDQRKSIEVSTLTAAAIAVGLAPGSLIYTLNTVDTLEERITTLEAVIQKMPKAAAP
jgi:hypothetical protein